ncbi:MAG: uroporphyrinogen-III synthase [Pseudomonadota bacterium]
MAETLEQAMPGRIAPVIAPLIEVVSEPADIDLDGVQALLFTSANGVVEFARRSPRRDIPCLCVGARTATVAAQHGLAAESADGDASNLAGLAMSAFLPGAGTFLHLRGRDQAGDLVGALLAEGVEARETILYAAEPRPLAAEVRARMTRGEMDAVTVFSTRTASLLVAAARDGVPWPTKHMQLVAISERAAAAAHPLGFGGIRVATHPSAEGMVKAIRATLGR